MNKKFQLKFLDNILSEKMQGHEILKKFSYLKKKRKTLEGGTIDDSS